MKLERYMTIICVLGIMCVFALGCEKMQKPVMDAMTDTGMTDTDTDTDTGTDTDTDTGMTGTDTDTDTGMEVDPDAIRSDDIVVQRTELDKTVFESYEDAIASAEVKENLTTVSDFLREHCGTDKFYRRGHLLHVIMFTHRNDRDKFMDYVLGFMERDLWYFSPSVWVFEGTNYFRIAYSPDDDIPSNPKCAAFDVN